MTEKMISHNVVTDAEEAARRHSMINSTVLPFETVNEIENAINQVDSMASLLTNNRFESKRLEPEELHFYGDAMSTLLSKARNLLIDAPEEKQDSIVDNKGIVGDGREFIIDEEDYENVALKLCFASSVAEAMTETISRADIDNKAVALVYHLNHMLDELVDMYDNMPHSIKSCVTKKQDSCADANQTTDTIKCGAVS